MLISYQRPKLNGEVIRFGIPKFEEIYRPSEPNHPFYTYHDKDFSKDRYKYSTLPVHIGPFDIDYKNRDIINVLRCPIKMSNSREIVLPVELEFVRDFVTFCCIYETSFNSRFDELFAHITVDRKKLTPAEFHRVPGFHVDGFQGHKFPIKHEIEHSYLWSSQLGTEFCVQPFFISHIDDSKYLIFDEFEKQMNKNPNGEPYNMYQCLGSNVYIFDPYMVHRTPIVTEPIDRLLIRITFEYQKLLDPNDTMNPAMKFKVPYKYDIRNRLGEYSLPLCNEMFGFIKK